MEAKTNYTMVGIIVLFLSASLISALLWLSVGFDSKQYDTYIVYVNESVHGLNDESPVKFNGVKVGFVSGIHLDSVNPQKIKLTLKIEQGIPITTSTTATLVTQGITGSTFLGLKASTPTETRLKAIGDDPYPIIPYTTSFFGRVEDNFTSISDSLKRVFDPENARRFKESLASLQQILNTIDKNNHNISQTLAELPKAITELKRSMHEFGNMATHLSSASTQFSSTMRSGKNTVDQISQETLPTITTLMRRLNIVAANLEEVSSQMRQNPAVIIRGSTPQPSGPGE